MSEDAYLADDDEAGYSLPDHISRLSPEEMEELFPGAVWEDQKIGFRSGADRNTRTGEITIAFAGTQDGVDWKNNIQQGLLGESPQYSRARDLARIVSSRLPNRPGALSFTGHSLGGGLAMEAAGSLPTSIRRVNHHRNAKTFNAAGVSVTISEVPRNVWNGAIGRNIGFENHVVVGDPLSAPNSIVPGMGTLGGVNYRSPVSLNPLTSHGISAFKGKFKDGNF